MEKRKRRRSEKLASKGAEAKRMRIERNHGQIYRKLNKQQEVCLNKNGLDKSQVHILKCTDPCRAFSAQPLVGCE